MSLEYYDHDRLARGINLLVSDKYRLMCLLTQEVVLFHAYYLLLHYHYAKAQKIIGPCKGHHSIYFIPLETVLFYELKQNKCLCRIDLPIIIHKLTSAVVI